MSKKLLAVFLFSFVLVATPIMEKTASAASAYDSAYRLTDHLYLRSGGNDLGDVSLSYQEIINNSFAWPSGWTSKFYYNGSEKSLTSTEANAMRTSWNDNKWNWTISQIGSGGDDQTRAITLQWTEAPNMELMWQAPCGSGTQCVHARQTASPTAINPKYSMAITVSASSKLVSLNYRDNNSTANIILGTISNNVTTGTSTYNASWNYLTNVANTNLPAGYAGIPIRDTITPPIPDTAFSPSWRYTVTDMNLKVKSLVPPEIVTEWGIETCWFQIPNNTWGDNFTEYHYDCSDPDEVEHDFSEYGNYNVLHFMQRSNGQQFISTRMLIIDGSSYSGVAGGNAEGNAVLTALQNITSNESFGLTNLVTAPLTFIAELPNATCSPLILTLPNMGNLTLPCLTPIYQTYFGSFFVLYQTVLTALFGYYFGINLFAFIKKTYDPKNDRIEVVQL